MEIFQRMKQQYRHYQVKQFMILIQFCLFLFFKGETIINEPTSSTNVC